MGFARASEPPPSRFWTAAVATMVLGHKVFDAIPSARSSSAMPSPHSVMPYLAIMYAVGLSHSDSSLSGGDRVRMCGFSRPTMWGMQACDTA